MVLGSGSGSGYAAAAATGTTATLNFTQLQKPKILAVVLYSTVIGRQTNGDYRLLVDEREFLCRIVEDRSDFLKLQHDCYDPPSSLGQGFLGVDRGHFGSVPDAKTAIVVHEIVHDTPYPTVKSSSNDDDIILRSEVACCHEQTALLNNMSGGLKEELRSDVAFLSDGREHNVGDEDVSGEREGIFGDAGPEQRDLVDGVDGSESYAVAGLGLMDFDDYGPDLVECDSAGQMGRVVDDAVVGVGLLLSCGLGAEDRGGGDASGDNGFCLVLDRDSFDISSIDLHVDLGELPLTYPRPSPTPSLPLV
ncbi:hypothetical protein Dimus_035085 [Dionaea muscipula]